MGLIKKTGSENGKRLIGITAAVVVALAGAALVYAGMLSSEKKLLEAYEKTTVIALAKDIPEGQRITEANMSDYFEEVLLPSERISEGGFVLPGELGGLQGKVTRIPLAKGTLVSPSMFAEREVIPGHLNNPVLVGIRAEDASQVGGGILRSGDLVGIYYRDADENLVSAGWDNVCIAQVFDSAGVMIAGESDAVAVRFNIYLEESEVERFYSLVNSGSIRMVKYTGKERSD